jgi:aminopeptidase N
VPMGDVLYDWLLHHELGHEWWGNKVSVGDWADFWIHEGLTAYGDWLFYLRHGGDDAYLNQVRNVKRGITHQQPIVSEKNATAKEAYHPEIYTKGAFVIHSLRFVLGDDLFFPLLKAFANDERFTYQNRVSTQDFVDFVHSYTGKDLDGLFHLYLYTTDIPEIKVKKGRKNSYRVWAENIDFQLPLEIRTSSGTKRYEVSEKPVNIKSETQPEIDPNDWFLLKK